MDALLTSFLLAALGEWGDKTQLLVLLFAARGAKPMPVLAGVAVGALANALLAATGGLLIHDFITLRAISLLVAVALLYAGAAGLIGRTKPDDPPAWRIGTFATAAICFFLTEFGDKTQFLTLAVSAHYGSLVLPALGATAGVLAAATPAILLGGRFEATLPVRKIRIGAAILFLLAGTVIAVNALRLV
ncbi:MAG TPA: TMEM165/GDT1 family protein [Allosphingosinicella sp.]|jgi:putative Ca2+/H+ antiporter (TMEM165/GDT1 family)